MLALQYGDHFLDIANPEQVVTRWVSTAFNEPDQLLGSGSVLSFELASTPANHALLKFANQLGNRLARQDIEVTVWIFGMPWKRCTFSFNLKDGRISGYTKIDNGEFADIIKKKPLPQVFVTTKNGAFIDHNWLVLGTDPAEVGAAVHASLVPGAAPYVFYPYINSKLMGEYTGSGSPVWEQPRVINPWKGTEFLWRAIDVPLADEKKLWFGPSLRLVWVIQQVCLYLGYEAVGDYFDDPFHQSLVIDNSSVYNWRDMFLDQDGFKIAPARHLPDLKLSDFFKDLREEFRIIYYFNSDTKQAHFSSSASVLASEVRVDLDGCIEKGRPSTEKSNDTGFELIQGIDDDDELFSFLPYIKSFFIGGDRARKPVNAPIGTCFMQIEPNAHAGGAIWRVPIKKQLGNTYGTNYTADSEAFNKEDYGRNSFSLRLLSYHGLIPDSMDNSYPYAVGDGLDVDGETSLCPSLWLGGDNGILENYHRRWYGFLLRTERVDLRALLTNQVLTALSPLRKVRFTTEEGVALEALLDQVEFSATNNSLLRAELRVYPNYNTAGADDALNTDFVAGEQINTGIIYVKLVMEDYKEYTRKPLFSAKVIEATVEDVVLYFYSDPEGTIPLDVYQLKVNINKHSALYRKYYDEPFVYVASGSKCVVLEDQISYSYRKGEHSKKYTWSVMAGGYTVITG